MTGVGLVGPDHHEAAEQVSLRRMERRIELVVNGLGTTPDRRRHPADVIERIASDDAFTRRSYSSVRRELEEWKRSGSGGGLGDEVGDNTLVEGHADSRAAGAVIASRRSPGDIGATTYVPAADAGCPISRMLQRAIEQIGAHRSRRPARRPTRLRWTSATTARGSGSRPVLAGALVQHSSNWSTTSDHVARGPAGDIGERAQTGSFGVVDVRATVAVASSACVPTARTGSSGPGKSSVVTRRASFRRLRSRRNQAGVDHRAGPRS